MQIDRLSLRGFRNYEDAQAQFVPGVNLLVGGNANGKTNLLEAVSYLSTGRSFRTRREAELIRFGADFAELRAQVQSQERTRELRMSFKEQREYETIDATMEKLQQALEQIDAQIEANASDFVKLTELSAKKEETQQALEAAEERWLYLTDLHERIEAQKNGGLQAGRGALPGLLLRSCD